MKLVEIPIVHVSTHSTSPLVGEWHEGTPQALSVDFDGIVARSIEWLNPDYIVSVREEPGSEGWLLIEGLRAKHSFLKDDVATDYGDSEKFNDEWNKENPEDRDEKWNDAEWEKWNEDWTKDSEAWMQAFCDKHGFNETNHVDDDFQTFQEAWRQWQLLHYAVQDDTPFDITELCPPHRTIYVQVGSACQAYNTLESIPDLLARINPGSQEALSAAFAAGGNR